MPTKPTTKPKPTHKEVLNAYGIDAICTRISSGESQRSIAKSLGVHDGIFVEWLAADPERFARTKAARANSASLWDEQAEKVLLDMEADPRGVARANALAHHYRWRAKAHNPRDFSGEKQQEENKDKDLAAVLRALADKLPT